MWAWNAAAIQRNRAEAERDATEAGSNLTRGCGLAAPTCSKVTLHSPWAP